MQILDDWGRQFLEDMKHGKIIVINSHSQGKESDSE